MFKTINKNISAEIVEKKSKFIANVFYVETVEEAEEKVKEIKKKYFDARHNCFAYSVFTKEGIVNRFSDDGEPSGTAGGPMLNILNGKELTNLVVIVTRYFGGILLGTGGLIRAYTGATQEALRLLDEVYKDLGLEAKLVTTYPELEKLKYYLKQNSIEITNTKYNETVEVFVDITEEKYNNILKAKEKYELNFELIGTEVLNEKYIVIENID
ncbi:MAG: YigZ family protein [Clostridia bacterium]|nr:YigZ family protein [Clostridia bacterium]